MAKTAELDEAARLAEEQRVTEARRLVEADCLAQVGEIRNRLETVDVERTELLGRRRDLFARLRSLEPPTPNRLIAEAAGLKTDEGVTAVLSRARKSGASD